MAIHAKDVIKGIGKPRYSKPRLWKTTVVIWSKKDPRQAELVDLAREATEGDAYCSKAEFIFVEDPKADPDWDGTEFFDDGAAP